MLLSNGGWWSVITTTKGGAAPIILRRSSATTTAAAAALLSLTKGGKGGTTTTTTTTTTISHPFQKQLLLGTTTTISSFTTTTTTTSTNWLSKKLLTNPTKPFITTNVSSTRTNSFSSSRCCYPTNLQVLRSLLPYLWPDSFSHRLRVLGSLTSLVLSKLATIHAPILLGALVDNIAAAAAAASTAPPPLLVAHALTTAATAAASVGGLPFFTEKNLLSPFLLPTVALLAAYFITRIAASFFTELRSALFAKVSQAACRQIAISTFSHLHSLDLSFLLSSRAGELSIIISRGVRATTQLLNMLIFQVLPTCLEFGLVLAILLAKVGVVVAGITLSTMVVYIAFTTLLTSYRTQLRQHMNATERRANALLLDSLTSAEAVRFFTNEQFEEKRYGREQKRHEQATVLVNQSLAGLNFGQQLIFNIGLATSLYVVLGQVMAGLSPVGHLVLCSSLLFQLAIPLNFIGTVYRETTLNLLDMIKLYQLRHHVTPSCQDPPNAQTFHFHKGDIEFKNVSFTFPNTNQADLFLGNQPPHHDTDDAPSTAAASRVVLCNFNLHVPFGKTYALVGVSGSGKSTLLKLLYRLYDPSEGEIRIDGQPVQNMSLNSFRKCLGVVPQDAVLFNDSVRFNIGYGRPDADLSEIIQVAKRAQIHDVISSLPHGYDTLVGERGLKLSGGEKQRICIARCLLRDPPIVLLDEATSSLDSNTEGRVLAAFREVARNRTCLIIAHRLTTVCEVDQIAVLANGQVAELGTHAELLSKQNGAYARLWKDGRMITTK